MAIGIKAGGSPSSSSGKYANEWVVGTGSTTYITDSKRVDFTVTAGKRYIITLKTYNVYRMDNITTTGCTIAGAGVQGTGNQTIWCIPVTATADLIRFQYSGSVSNAYIAYDSSYALCVDA